MLCKGLVISMELTRYTAHEAADLLEKREVSSAELTKAVIERIETVDAKVESFLTTTFDDALREAEEVDNRRASGEKLHRLAGVPTAIKDNICTRGVRTTCASKMLENFVPPYDAFVTKQLKTARTPVLGKLNLDEFAMGSSTENSYFKKTKNPHNLSKVPGGSSGGSAAAVSADLAYFALGSDTGGSIRQPASFCGVVGLKPTYGLVSRFGLVAFASSLDQIGPLCKDVEDAGLVLNLIAGHDKMDSTSLGLEKQDYTAGLKQGAEGLTIGVPEEYMGQGIDASVKQAILSAVQQYETLGAKVEYFTMSASKYALPAYYIISSAEASSNLARYDGVKYGYRTENYSNLMELYKNTRSEGFGSEVKRRIMLGTYALSSGYYDAYYKKAQQVRTIIRRNFESAFEKYDIILTPTAPTTAFGMGEKTTDPMQMYLADICTVSVNIAGLPAISLPCGTDAEGMPIGMQLIGRAFDEQTILRAAHAYEKSANLAIRPTIEGGADR